MPFVNFRLLHKKSGQFKVERDIATWKPEHYTVICPTGSLLHVAVLNLNGYSVKWVTQKQEASITLQQLRAGQVLYCQQ